MNEEVLMIALTQFFEAGIGQLGILAVMLCPMVFGGLTTYYCLKAQGPITEQVWKEWREDPEFQKQKVTTSINYND
jgi:hypothetical protein